MTSTSKAFYREKMSVRILGIDPGSRVTGFGVIDFQDEQMRHVNHGIIQLGADESFPLRLRALGESITEIISRYRPNVVVIEKIFLGKNADSAFKLGHARGVVMYEASCADLPVFEYATRLVKKGITGKGSAEKTDVQVMIQAFLNISEIKKLDASDALAMACYHALEMKKQKILNQAVEL